MKKNLLKISFLSALMFSLTSCSDIGKEFENITSKVWPNVWVVIAQIISFTILCLFVFFFAYKPIKKNIESRKNYVESNIEDSRKNLEESKISKAKADASISEAKQQANEIITRANVVSDEIKEKAVVDAKTQAEEIKLNNEKELIRQKEEMKEQINNEIISNSLLLTEEILKRNINEDDNKELINQFIDNMESEKK